MRNVFYITVCLIVFAFTGQAQNESVKEDDVQSWNEAQLTVDLSKQFEFYAAGSLRFSKNIASMNDGRYAVGLVYKPNKALSFQPLYWYIKSRNLRSGFMTEHRLNLRVGYRFPIKKIGLSHRSSFEYRLRQPRNSFRYRPSLTVEKDIPKNIIPESKIYLTEEIFYDSLANKFSRHRITLGVAKTLTKNLSLDLNFMRQNDSFTRPGDLSVIGTSLKIKL